jgi:hypothetical protein
MMSPAWQERFQRALRKALNTPPKHRTAPDAEAEAEAEGAASIEGARSQGEDSNLNVSYSPFATTAGLHLINSLYRTLMVVLKL